MNKTHHCRNRLCACIQLKWKNELTIEKKQTFFNQLETHPPNLSGANSFPRRAIKKWAPRDLKGFYLVPYWVGEWIMMTWFQGAFPPSCTCLSGLSLLLTTWGTSKRERWPTKHFFLISHARVWILCMVPHYKMTVCQFSTWWEVR